MQAIKGRAKAQKTEPGGVAHAFTPSTRAAEAGEKERRKESKDHDYAIISMVTLRGKM